MPIAPLVGAAIIGGGAQAVGSAFQSRATGQAANRQALASREAAQLQRQTSQEQLDFTKEQSRYLMAQAERDREANYNQWLADQKNVELGGWDAAVNRRAIYEQQAEQAYADRLAQGRNQYDEWEASQQRLGTLGQLTNMDSRYIPGMVESPYRKVADLQRSERTYPGYVPGLTEAPPDPAIAANAKRDAERYAAIQRQAAAPYLNYSPLPGTRTV